MFASSALVAENPFSLSNLETAVSLLISAFVTVTSQRPNWLGSIEDPVIRRF